MRRAARLLLVLFLAAVALLACHQSAPEGVGGSGGITFHDGAGGGDGGCALILCDEHNPCKTTTCSEDGGCSTTATPKGTICEGSATDPIHGECSGDPQAPTCDIQEWTCLRNPPGTPCQGGICDKHQTCCSGGCINSDGYCSFGGQNGEPCPVP